ncbi:uncharacterized protein LOC131929920 [Physella acuta]|uniref:uncharacterized protein LOC131929920 n=1 Tax=Physella acuta TaxID=109671 RepID=UPI0027DAD60C|nr:uncharacterized protein LOC131929920 [Physella acuta]
MSLLRQAIAQASLVYKAFSARVGQKMAASAVQPQIRSSLEQSKEDRVAKLKEELRYRQKLAKEDNDMIIHYKGVLERDPKDNGSMKIISNARKRLSVTNHTIDKIRKELTDLGA